MTDDTRTDAASETETTVVAATIADDRGVLAEAAVAVQGDHALVVGRFANPDIARAIYDDLLTSEIDGSLHIDGVLVVKADPDGRIHVQEMTEHSTKTGLKWGIVGGVIAGIIFPPSILASAAAFGTMGAAAGKARNIAHRIDVEKQLAPVITPGTSGILALVTAVDAPAVDAKMAGAEEVKTIPVDAETAGSIKERQPRLRASHRDNGRGRLRRQVSSVGGAAGGPAGVGGASGVGGAVGVAGEVCCIQSGSTAADGGCGASGSTVAEPAG